MTIRAAKTRTTRKLPVDREAHALMQSTAIRTVLQEARNTPRTEDVSAEELDRRRPLSDAEQAHAQAYGDALDRLEQEQGAGVTDDQGRLLRLVLIAAEHARGETPLMQLVEESGLAESDIHAVAAALVTLGLSKRTVAA